MCDLRSSTVFLWAVQRAVAYKWTSEKKNNNQTEICIV